MKFQRWDAPILLVHHVVETSWEHNCLDASKWESESWVCIFIPWCKRLFGILESSKVFNFPIGIGLWSYQLVPSMRVNDETHVLRFRYCCLSLAKSVRVRDFCVSIGGNRKRVCWSLILETRKSHHLSWQDSPTSLSDKFLQNSILIILFSYKLFYWPDMLIAKDVDGECCLLQ